MPSLSMIFVQSFESDINYVIPRQMMMQILAYHAYNVMIIYLI